MSAGKFVLGVGPADLIQKALRRNESLIDGYETEILEWLAKGDNIVYLSRVIAGSAEIVHCHVVDGDETPVIPLQLTIKKHVKCGRLRWRKEVNLFLSERQKEDGGIVGYDLLKELAGKKVMNVCILDYLERNPHLIPESWKGKKIFFWGTIYQDGRGSLHVRYLHWDGVWFESSHKMLGQGFGKDDLAALAA